ncbi:Adenylate and Guanylate cyclase catalytic domain containing protein [Novymonas esmeraldas]|uniref:Adenylate and Guanylate cyclase catalytic domain containing protein n=1 Tax=Novymonas esmeraldas TaxID=1808958 RepID=A0AAW0EVI2_9TRYP
MGAATSIAGLRSVKQRAVQPHQSPSSNIVPATLADELHATEHCTPCDAVKGRGSLDSGDVQHCEKDNCLLLHVPGATDTIIITPPNAPLRADAVVPTGKPRALEAEQSPVRMSSFAPLSPPAGGAAATHSGKTHSSKFLSVLSDDVASPCGAAGSDSKLGDSVMKDYNFVANNTGAGAGTARRLPVVSFGGPSAATGEAADITVVMVDTTADGSPADTPLHGPAAKRRYQGARQSMPFAESDAESTATTAPPPPPRRASVVGLNPLYGGMTETVVEPTATDNAEYAERVSKQMAAASEDLDEYTSNMRVLLRSWEIVSEHYDALVDELGHTIGAEHPEYGVLFVNSSLAAQARVMLNMIGEALVIVARPNEMFSTLLEMGALHRRYNVCEEHFRALQSAFMRILPKYLPAELQASCEAAWTPFWTIVVQLLVHGRESARGDWHEAEQQRTFLAESRRVMKEILSRKTTSERGTFMMELLEGAVRADASMERFSQLRDRRTAIRAFNGIIRLLEGSEDTKGTELLMEELSFRHTVYGLDSAAMQTFRQPFVDTCHYSMWKKKCLEEWRPETKRSLGAFWDYVTVSWENALHSTAKSREAQAERAPDGAEPFCMMFTDIEGSTRLWERNPTVMGEAVEAHHRIVRSAIADYGAYEVKTVGDSFVIAAKDALIALKIALAIQLELMRGPITPGFEMVDNVQGSGPAECWRNDSLRVRIGIHYCRDASAVYDSVQRRYDYYGPGVNCTARTESAAGGGQILITEDALDMIRAMPGFSCVGRRSMVDHQTHYTDGNGHRVSIQDAQEVLNGSRPLADVVVVRDWGEHTFKGIAKNKQLFSVLPTSLAGRVFELPSKSLGSSAAHSRVGSVMSFPKPSSPFT